MDKIQQTVSCGCITCNPLKFYVRYKPLSFMELANDFQNCDENEPLPLTWALAYATACNNIQAMVTNKKVVKKHILSRNYSAQYGSNKTKVRISITKAKIKMQITRPMQLTIQDGQ